MMTVFLAAALLGQSTWTPATEAQLSRAFTACMARGAAAEGNSPAMDACTTDEIDRQDVRLNQAYAMVMKRLPTARRAQLRTSERQWIGRRDAACERARAEAGGGTASITEFNGCYLNETIKRRLWLERYR